MGKERNRLLSYIECLVCLKGVTVGNTILLSPVAVYINSPANFMSAPEDLMRDDSGQ